MGRGGIGSARSVRKDDWLAHGLKSCPMPTSTPTFQMRISACLGSFGWDCRSCPCERDAPMPGVERPILSRGGAICRWLPSFLRSAEEKKVAENNSLCALAGWGFAPAAFSPWGATGSNAGSLLYELSRRATAHLAGWRRTQKVQEFYENVSITLTRSVSRALSAKNMVQDRVRASRARSDAEKVATRLVDR